MTLFHGHRLESGIGWSLIAISVTLAHAPIRAQRERGLAGYLFEPKLSVPSSSDPNKDEQWACPRRH